MGSGIPEGKNFDYLQDKTRNLLLELERTAPFLCDYSLVGGSALALFLCHRKSEDLNFFTYSDTFNQKAIIDYCRLFKSYEILNQSSDQLDLLIDGVNTTFFNAKWDFLRPEKPGRLNIAALSAIATMKINVLFLRAKYRDYYDLYFLADQVFSLNELFDNAKQVVPGLTRKLFCIALSYIDDIEDDSIDHLEPVLNLTKEEIRSFFEDKIKKSF